MVDSMNNGGPTEQKRGVIARAIDFDIMEIFV